MRFDPKSFAQRLWDVIDGSDLSIRDLHRRLAGVEGSSYPSIHRYLAARKPRKPDSSPPPTQPPAAFVVAASEVLGVLPGWLLTGEGPRTKLEADRHREAFDQVPKLLDDDRHYLPFVEDLDFLGTGNEGESRRRALLRFARKLDDVSMLTSEMYDVDERAGLIRAAAVFLVEVERAFQAAADTSIPHTNQFEPRPLVRLGHLLGTSSSGGWLLEWQDAILELFGRRVIGLGERSSRWGDLHHPIGQDPDTAAYEQLRATTSGTKTAQRVPTPDKAPRGRKPRPRP